MSTPHIVLLRRVALSILFSIVSADIIHDVVVAEDLLYILTEIVDLASDAGIWDCSIASEGLQSAGADMEQLHDVLAVEEFLEVDGGFVVIHVICPPSVV